MNADSEKKIPLLWSDARLAVLDKPAGLLVHRTAFASDTDSLVDRLKGQFESPPSPVHRLDRPVSGVLLAAFDSRTAALLGRFFEEGRVHKTYLAVVRGHLTGEGRIDRELRKPETENFQSARTTYRSLDTVELDVPSRRFPTSRFSLVEVAPQTGRFHQIRRHLAGIGYPIIGDSSHGDTATNALFREHWGERGLLLHALHIEFPHPEGERLLWVESPVREEMREFLLKTFPRYAVSSNGSGAP